MRNHIHLNSNVANSNRRPDEFKRIDGIDGAGDGAGRIHRLLKALAIGAGLLALVFAGSGCQTPTTPQYSGSDAYDEALRSYENCRSRLYPYGAEDACDDVGSSYGSSGQGMSYNQYYGNPYGGGSSYGNGGYGSGYYRPTAQPTTISPGRRSGSFYNPAMVYTPEEYYGASNLKAGYGNYLSTLSENQLRNMAAQWDRL